MKTTSFVSFAVGISILFSLQAQARPNLDLTCSNDRLSMSIVEVNDSKGEVRGLVVSAKQIGPNGEATSQPRFIEMDPNSAGTHASYLSQDLNSVGNLVLGLKVIHVVIDSQSHSVTGTASNYKIDALVSGANGSQSVSFSRENCQGLVPTALVE